MKTLILASIVIMSLLVVTGTAIAVTNGGPDVDQEPTETIECSSCGNSCTASSNCGRASCGAVSGGSCGCGG